MEGSRVDHHLLLIAFEVIATWVWPLVRPALVSWLLGGG
jgi:hypothetical protein